MLAHFIYCGEYYFEVFQGDEYAEKLKKIILAKMEKYGIESSILTMLMMQRQNLITKEKTKLYYGEKIPNSILLQIHYCFSPSINYIQEWTRHKFCVLCKRGK